MSARTVWLETSNALIATEGRLGSSVSGGTQSKGGHLITAGAQHWSVRVGALSYQAGHCEGVNLGDVFDASEGLAGCTEVGSTERTDEAIDQWLDHWNEELGGARPYNLVTNSCQTFAVHLVRWLCLGEGKLPILGGISLIKDSGSFVAAAGFGELACASFGGAKVALSGPAASLQGVARRGAFFDASLGVAEVGTDTPFGRLGIYATANVCTGIGVRDGNAEANVLGFGMKAGKDGMGIKTPIGGADCSIM